MRIKEHVGEKMYSVWTHRNADFPLIKRPPNLEWFLERTSMLRMLSDINKIIYITRLCIYSVYLKYCKVCSPQLTHYTIEIKLLTSLGKQDNMVCLVETSSMRWIDGISSKMEKYMYTHIIWVHFVELV